jgi:hypothetical protein
MKFSICIPTMNRFDDFLTDYLEIYVEMKKRGTIDEIIVSDETGEDYQKIIEKFGIDGPVQVYKNEKKLGAFKNKLRASSYAKSENFIAVIDSDNLVDDSYFKAAQHFIESRQIKNTDDIVLCPYHTISDYEFDYSEFANMCFDYIKAREYAGFKSLHNLLNTGNYIITKHVYDNLIVLDGNIDQAGPFDVIYKHLLAFQQNPRYRIYVVEDMKYFHNVHIQSFYLQNHQSSMAFYSNIIIPELCRL